MPERYKSQDEFSSDQWLRHIRGERIDSVEYTERLAELDEESSTDPALALVTNTHPRNTYAVCKGDDHENRGRERSNQGVATPDDR